jgi:DnaK suppressor protein
MKTRRTRAKRSKPRASSQDVLGGANDAAKVPVKWRKHFGLLVRAREEILRRQRDLANDAAQEQPTFSMHMADAGTDTYDRDLALGVLSAEHDAIYQVDQAIDRIRTGRYGVCEMTGKPIERARLDAVPWTRFSATAEKQMEAEGHHKRARLGSRETLPRGAETEAPEPVPPNTGNVGGRP